MTTRLLAAAIERIARLNRRHGPAPDAGAHFLLLHRRRVWNDSEGQWMGWERKRGKLQELNQLLLGHDGTTFMGSRLDVPTSVRYVITLDADTRLPRGAALRLVGTMAHPLNRPAFDARAGRVVEGYAVLQPRSRPRCPAIVTLRSSGGSPPGRRASIPMRPRPPTSTRTSSEEAHTPARASMTSRRSPGRWRAGSLRMRS